MIKRTEGEELSERQTRADDDGPCEITVSVKRSNGGTVFRRRQG